MKNTLIVILCCVLVGSSLPVWADKQSKPASGNDDMAHMRYLRPEQVVDFINRHDGVRPLFVYFTRKHLIRENGITDTIANQYRGKLDFVYTRLPAGSMSAFRHVEPLSKKYKFQTLPASIIVQHGRLLAKADMISMRKYPEAYYRKQIDSALMKVGNGQ